MGQIGAAFSNPNTFAPDPSGFNSSEWGARVAGDAGKGFFQGLSKMGQQPQQGGGAPPIIPTQGPQAPLFSAQNLPGRNPFYGQ